MVVTTTSRDYSQLLVLLRQQENVIEGYQAFTDMHYRAILSGFVNYIRFKLPLDKSLFKCCSFSLIDVKNLLVLCRYKDCLRESERLPILVFTSASFNDRGQAR